MPEGHTIHRAARDHEQDLRNQPVRISSPQGRFDAESVGGPEGETRLLRVEACGKHLFYFFAGEQIVHVHLGLFGKFKRRRSPAPEPRPTTRMRLEGAKWTIDLVGPTACELLTDEEMGELMARLGPDPLRDDADPTIFYRYVARSRTPIGAILMDQSRIAGVGNVYRAEVLHLEGIHPDTPGSKVPAEKLQALWQLIVGLLRRGVEEKRIVTTRGLTLEKPRERVSRAESTHVYGRKECRSCGGEVIRYTLRARSVFVCEACQPRVENRADA
jgi:formamidopyrimidine-DNA glycosylase